MVRAERFQAPHLAEYECGKKKALGSPVRGCSVAW